MVQPIEYEGLHVVCFGCGVVGYREQTCPLGKAKELDNADMDFNAPPVAETEEQQQPEVILKDGDTVAKYCGHLVCDGERFVRSPVLCDRQCCNHNDKGSVNRRHLHSKEIAATMRSQYGKERNQNSLTER
nr:reverse transcriptase [Ipomoea batatas]